MQLWRLFEPHRQRQSRGVVGQELRAAHAEVLVEHIAHLIVVGSEVDLLRLLLLLFIVTRRVVALVVVLAENGEQTLLVNVEVDGDAVFVVVRTVFVVVVVVRLRIAIRVTTAAAPPTTTARAIAAVAVGCCGVVGALCDA